MSREPIRLPEFQYPVFDIILINTCILFTQCHPIESIALAKHTNFSCSMDNCLNNGKPFDLVSIHSLAVITFWSSVGGTPVKMGGRRDLYKFTHKTCITGLLCKFFR